MKTSIRIVLLVAVYLLVSSSGIAQAGEVIYAITLQGDTIKGTSLKRSQSRKYHKQEILAMKSLTNLELIEIPYKDIAEYTVYNSGARTFETFEFVKSPIEVIVRKKYNDHISDARILHRLEKGAMNLYMQIVYKPTGFGASAPNKYYYISRDKIHFLYVGDIEIEQLKAELADCPELSAKLGTKEYKKLYRHIQKIIKEYNECVQ